MNTHHTRSLAVAFVILSGSVGFNMLTAATIIDDHFTGNSGTIPAGWVNANPGATSFSAVESGSTVAISAGPGGGPGLLSSNSMFSSTTPPTISIAVDVASLTSGGQVISSFGGSLGNSFVGIVDATGAASANYFDGVNFNGIALGDVGDPLDGIQLTLLLDATTFSLISDEGFDSGTTSYSSIDGSFTSLSVFGSSLGVGVGAGASGGGVETIAIDRVVVNASPVPEPSAPLLGVLSLLGFAWGHRRRR